MATRSSLAPTASVAPHCFPPRISNKTSFFTDYEISDRAAIVWVGSEDDRRIRRLKIRHCGVRCPKTDHPDRSETSEGHHADYNTDDIRPDRRGEDEDQRAACTSRCRTRN